MLLSVEQHKWVMDWLKGHRLNRCPLCGQPSFQVGNAFFELPGDCPKVQVTCTACGNVLFFDAALLFSRHDPLILWDSKAQPSELELLQQLKHTIEQAEDEDFNPS